MKKLFLILFFSLFILNCSKDILLNFEKHQRGENPFDPLYPPMPSDENSGKWVFMVYLDAANNLEYAGVADLQEMVEGSKYVNTNNIRIIVLMDRIDGYSTADGDWKTTKLFEIKNGTKFLINTTINGQNTDGSVDFNMGHPDNLKEFIKYCLTKYSNYDYFLLDLWNHGGGWKDSLNSLENALPRKAICWDEDSGNDTLYMDEVQSALSSALGSKKLNLIYMDACLMQMVEVGYELRNLTKYLVASEETVPGNGGDYVDILKRMGNLFNESKATPFMVAYEIVSSYRAQYYSTSDTTLSALNLEKISTLKVAIDTFSQNLMKLSGSQIKNIRSSVKDFTYNDQADLYHFAKLCNEKISGGVPGAFSVMEAIDSMIVKEYHNSSTAGAYGLAIYFPRTPKEVKIEYTSNFYYIDFISDSKWNDFIKWYKNQ